MLKIYFIEICFEACKICLFNACRTNVYSSTKKQSKIIGLDGR